MRVLPEVLQDVRRHGEVTYPEECCGFLLGNVSGGGNLATAAFPADNRRSEHRERRYQITPADYHRASRAADERGLDIVGFYHSHPDHPAQPSQTDLEEASFPGFTYLIVSVQKGRSADLTAWSLAPDRSRFEPEEIEELTSPETKTLSTR